jgi:diguanylate cyclase (GGDEF)-like protein/PAS domain S-box-containing protein
MYNTLFQQLTLNELDRYADELEQAIENHARWRAQINRVLICKLPPAENDLAEHPDQLCKFGRWYHGVNNPVLTTLESYKAINPVHRQMHAVAKQLLLVGVDGKDTSQRYDELLTLAEELRVRLGTLLNELNHNRILISRLMSKVFDNASEGVMITDPDTTIVSINAAFTKVTGYTEEEAVGHKPSLLRSGHQDNTFYAHMWHEINTFGQWQGEIWNRNKNGEEYLEWLSVAAVKNEKDEISHYLGIFSDITSEKESEERLLYLAHYDQLTGLPNRILFNDRLTQALAQAKREQLQVAVMFLDLDGFKSVNDTLGHNAGDELLKQVAQRLTTCLRATDSVARFGGDEFTIVLPAIDDRIDVIRVANKIIEEVARPYLLEGNDAAITTSIGISFYPSDGDDPNVLIHRADNAMYHAKRHGKNHHEFYGEI